MKKRKKIEKKKLGKICKKIGKYPDILTKKIGKNVKKIGKK